MELFQATAATSIRSNHTDLAFSALPDAPVQPAKPIRAATTSSDRRPLGLRSLLDRIANAVTTRPVNRPATAECANVHCSAPIQARIGGWRE